MSEIDGTDGRDAQGQDEKPKPSTDERKRMLAEAIQRQVVQGGRVESQSDFQAVIVSGQRPNHTLHAIITVFTCGIWGIVWIVIAMTGGERRTMITVDEYGNLLIQQLGKS